MPPKKGKGKGKKGKKGKKGALGVDPDDFLSFNVAQRQVLTQLFAQMRKNQEENTEARRKLKETKQMMWDMRENQVSGGEDHLPSIA